MPSFPGSDLTTRRRVISVFLTQGVAGLAVMVLFTWLRWDQTRIILEKLGPNAPALLIIAAAFTLAMALLKFELTSEIFVSLVITSAIAFLPLLGGVMTAWMIVIIGTTVRWLSLKNVGPARLEVEDLPLEYVRTFSGQFATYGIPVVLAATIYERIGGELPLVHATPGNALRVIAAGLIVIATNLIIMFWPKRSYGYTMQKIVKVDSIDASIDLCTLPYAIVLAMSYGSMGYGAVLALAFTGVLANLIARNLAMTRERSQRQLQRLASLTNIGKTISLRFTTDQLLMAIYTECRKIVDCTLFTIALLDEESNELSFELDVREETALPKDRIPVGEGLNSWVVRHHQPLLIGSVADEMRYGVKAVADSKPTESWLGVPMIARDRVIGVISVESYKKNAFGNDDVVLLTAIANQAAVALENAHLYKDLESLTYALEQRVMERTNELREANLRLLAADRSKNQFLANMSHELRTPLNSIIGFSSVLLESARNTLQSRLYRFLENIHTAGNHLLELINDILDLSKIEAGKMELRPGRFDLRETMAAVERVMKGFASEANVHIITSVAPNVPMVRLDEGRLKQILFNLLSNAVKFSPNGGPVTVNATAIGKERSPLAVDSIRIEIADQGIGIQAEELSRIFDEFYQTEEGRRSRRGGTGLGLSLTRNFVELHFGTIEVQSAPGKGSCFILYLPVDYSEASAAVPMPMLHTTERVGRA
jgi:signal transduction histidine kinase